MLSTGQLAQIACIWEATARKPGNVHRFADFADTQYPDFLLSAAAIAPFFDSAANYSVGELVLQAIRATKEVVLTNTNLGIVLLLSPLAGIPDADFSPHKCMEILKSLTTADSARVYEAIRLANPGGLGKVSKQDVGEQPTEPLKKIMALAADRDLIARQYSNGFQELFGLGVPALLKGLESTGYLEDAIIYCHLSLLAELPDSLILRKRGSEEAKESSRNAKEILQADWPNNALAKDKFTQFDRWLRQEGNSRNPGATADLVAASLFVALREHKIKIPSPWPWSSG